MLGFFSQIYIENQDYRAQQDDLKFCEKESSNKAADWKDRAEEISVAEKELENIKDGLRTSQ